MIGISQSSARRAIIDIGSNTVRLVVYNGPPRSPVVVLNEKVNARLGKDLGRTGAIGEKSMRTALAALARFATLLRLQGWTTSNASPPPPRAMPPMDQHSLRPCAASVSPRLLSGEEEARASATGVIAAFPGARGIAADLGGGSLELVEIDAAVPGASLRAGSPFPSAPCACRTCARWASRSSPLPCATAFPRGAGASMVTTAAAGYRSTSSAVRGARWRCRRCACSTGRWTIRTASNSPRPRRCISPGSSPRASSRTPIRASPPRALPPCPTPPR
ncbi:hypothetical protein ACFSLT_10520 [Novosphingobium resinovorum]